MTTPRQIYEALVVLKDAMLDMQRRLDIIEVALSELACGRCDQAVQDCTCCPECATTPCACQPALRVIEGGRR